MTEVDLLLRGGSVVDGTGAEPYAADVGVRDGRIAAIGPPGSFDDVGARTVVEAAGLLVLPGFVDTHVHADAVLTRPDVQEAMLRQGITTVVLGQDGLSFAPASAATVGYVARYFAAVDGAPPEALAAGCSVADLLHFYDRRTPLNVGYLVPLGTVRQDVLGPDDHPAGAELGAMVRLVEQGLADGAVGVSTGLEYVPGVFADLPELTALCRPAARVNAPYVSHLRSYADGTAPGMAEARDLARATGVAVHASHYRGRVEPLCEHLAGFEADGLDVSFDSYPHLWANTILAMKGLPAHVQAGGVDATVARLSDPAVRAELARSWFPSVEDDLAPAVLAYVAGSAYRWAEGLSIAETCMRTGMPFGELVCELLAASDLAVGCLVPMAKTFGDESDVRALLRDDRHMGCSDGIYLGGHPHPRGWAAFARFLGRHTRELGDWTWGAAARHLAGHPAERFGLAGRGVLAAGHVADLAVVDPAAVADRATYDDPRRLADGVSHVVVAGELVLSDAKPTGATPGRALHRGERGL